MIELRETLARKDINFGVIVEPDRPPRRPHELAAGHLEQIRKEFEQGDGAEP